jgi:opacity protein-like surface antigen
MRNTPQLKKTKTQILGRLLVGRHRYYASGSETKHTMKKFIAVILAALTLGTLAQAQNAKKWEVVPIDVVAFNSCTGEDIDLAGNVWTRITTVDDGSGGFHVNFQFRAKADGVGLNSGLAYSINNSAHETFHISGKNLGSSYTFTQHWKLISQGSGENGYLRTTIHLTVNANGKITAEVFNDLFDMCI